MINLGRPVTNYQDLFISGCQGMCRAIQLYDCRQAQFSTYAYFWIQQAVRREIHNNDSLIRVPEHNYNKVRHFVDNLDDIQNSPFLEV